jgi:toxin CcdB
MTQFDVHRNASEKTFAEFPYLLEIQSNLFEDSSRVVVIPLVLASAVTDKDSTLNPELEVEAVSVSIFPLDISSMNKNLLGETVASLRSDGDRIIAALDLLFARF